MQKRAKLARAKEQRLEAELAAAEMDDELASRASVIDDEAQELQDRLQMAGLGVAEALSHAGDVTHASSRPEQPHADMPSCSKGPAVSPRERVSQHNSVSHPNCAPDAA